LEKELSNFQQLHNMSMVGNKNYQIVLNMLKPEKMNVDSLKTTWKGLVQINTNNFNQISDSLGIFSREDSAYMQLQASRLKYLNSVNNFFELLRICEKDKRYALFMNTISEDFILYQVEINNYTQCHKKRIIDRSKDISNEVTESSFGFMILGFSPFIFIVFIGIIYVLLASGFLLYMFFRPPISE